MSAESDVNIFNTFVYVNCGNIISNNLMKKT